MPFKHISSLVFLVLLAVYTIAFLGGAAGVPFHPDESTYIFMSADFEQLFRAPGALAWQPEAQDNPILRYRIQDAPLGRYLIGLGRALAGLPPLPVDWDWSRTWEENRQAGALPSPQLLLAARLAVAALTPLSVLLLFLTGRRLANERVAWLSALLLAGNALVLLHARRAMSEGPVVFTVALLLWSLTVAEKRPWLTALPAALAFCAKHSLAALAPVSLLAVLWQPKRTAKGVGSDLLRYAALFILVVAALNPALWAHPIAAAQAALHSRQELLARQVADRPEQVMRSPAVRVAVMLGSLFLVQPIFAETTNYTQETRPAERAYLANPFHSLLRSPAAGGVLLLAYLYGHLALILQAARRRPLPRAALLLLAAVLLQALALLATVPLPFQRYYLPLVPHACLWTAFGIDRLLKITRIARSG